MLADYIFADKSSKPDQVVIQLSEPESRQLLFALQQAEIVLKNKPILIQLINCIKKVLIENDVTL
ncbi:MAG: hypothetical protein EB127_22100 [Alphaproteobacteria bacterium]|nr:hypothetical protein [Alphaproteobacteria bacterium]